MSSSILIDSKQTFSLLYFAASFNRFFNQLDWNPTLDHHLERASSA